MCFVQYIFQNKIETQIESLGIILVYFDHILKHLK